MGEYPWEEDDYDEAVKAYEKMIGETDLEDRGDTFMAWMFAIEWLKGKETL